MPLSCFLWLVGRITPPSGNAVWPKLGVLFYLIHPNKVPSHCTEEATEAQSGGGTWQDHAPVKEASTLGHLGVALGAIICILSP